MKHDTDDRRTQLRTMVPASCRTGRRLSSTDMKPMENNFTAGLEYEMANRWLAGSGCDRGTRAFGAVTLLSSPVAACVNACWVADQGCSWLHLHRRLLRKTETWGSRYLPMVYMEDLACRQKQFLGTLTEHNHLPLRYRFQSTGCLCNDQRCASASHSQQRAGIKVSPSALRRFHGLSII
jgi:hypothetical protein